MKNHIHDHAVGLNIKIKIEFLTNYLPEESVNSHKKLKENSEGKRKVKA